MFYLPLFHNLKGSSCLVVGAGTTALRKVRWLLRAEASIRIVAPDCDPQLKSFVESGEIAWVERGFESSDIDSGLGLVIAATADEQVNREVSEACRQHGVPVNCVDRADLSTVIFPSIIDRYPVLIAVSSMGVAPVLARVVRGWIEARLPARLDRLADLAVMLRDQVRTRLTDISIRRAFWEGLLQGPAGEVAMRGDMKGAEQIALDALDSIELPVGVVSLVGAGPGDPELITIKGQRLLQSADVVLYDKLVNPEILEYARRDAELVDVGKSGPRPGQQPDRLDNRANQQQAINDLLIEYAEQGLQVVRLKGGDPFIYGRGGEEIEALLEKNIEVLVVPGITAALGAASYAGIPLTHRNVAQSVRLVTGHRVENTVNLDWPELARDDQTLVIYMGLVGLPQIMSRLMEAGCDTGHPVAVVENATQPEQQVLRTTVARAAHDVEEAGITGPSVVIVGNVVTLAREH